MANVNGDSSQGESGGNEPLSSPAHPGPALHGGDKVYKSGPLFLSSKGIGWTSWKKRWFILTRTSLVFFRSDPNVVPQKGSEVNLTLGGIDLNSSGSVVVKEDKKLLTVLFPDGRDGRDGRAFTLKAETLEDLYEWKIALEEALSNAPNAAHAVGQNVASNEQSIAADGSEQSKDRQAAKSLVIGRPILLALEDIDGNPSFLEKALRFLEVYGVKTEGILRQAADVDDVERRIREYENGKCEFSSEEDPHVIADCIKYVLRELPSSPVPASCCNALLEACRTERSTRLNAMRTAICETFPEPNRRLLQRILIMMQTIASHKAINRMSTSAVAACMAPLLLRPLLSGDCDLENDFDVGGDGSVQLLQAAAAANHAQTIIITLLDEYESIFGEGSADPEPYTDSEESGSESEEITDDSHDEDDSFDDDYDEEEDGCEDATGDSDIDLDEDLEHKLRVTSSETGEHEYDKKIAGCHGSGSEAPQEDDIDSSKKLSTSHPQLSALNHNRVVGTNSIKKQSNEVTDKQSTSSSELPGANHFQTPVSEKSSIPSHGPSQSVKRPAVWGRTPAKKNLSMESIDLSFDDEAEIQNLEFLKTDLEDRIADEAKALQDSLERRKCDLHERRLALEKDVSRLQEQLQREVELRAALEAGGRISQLPLSVSFSSDERTKAELEEVARAESDVLNLTHKAEDIEQQLIQLREQNTRIGHEQLHHNPSHKAKSKEKHKKDVRVSNIAGTSEKLSSDKNETYLNVPDTDKPKKQQSPRSPNIQLPTFQEIETARNSKSSSVSSTCDMSMTRPLSRKSSTRGEGTNSTTSALSKLTNRLNFLKERRSQIASELQILDKGRNSSEPVQYLYQGSGSEDHLTHPNMGKHQEIKGGQSLENRRELENNELLQSPWEQFPHNNRGDKGAKLESHPNLERGKSESFPIQEKGSSKMAPRTYSR